MRVAWHSIVLLPVLLLPVVVTQGAWVFLRLRQQRFETFVRVYVPTGILLCTYEAQPTRLLLIACFFYPREEESGFASFSQSIF